MRKVLPVVVSVVVLVGVSVAHGLRTDRWATTTEVEVAARKLSTMPRTIGDWVGTDYTLDAKQVAIAEANGQMTTRFRHDKTGEELTILLLSGRPGPMSVHTPDVCYPGSGYQMVGPASKSTIVVNRSHTFNVGDFKNEGVDANALRIYWGWTSDGFWTAPDWPRKTFATRRALYKLYVITNIRSSDPALRSEPVEQFMQEFLRLFLGHIQEAAS